MHWKNITCIQHFSYDLKGRDHFGDLGRDGGIIIKWISAVGFADVSLTHVT